MPTTTTKKTTGSCLACGAEIGLNADGYTNRHTSGQRRGHCPGSGLRPSPRDAAEVAERLLDAKAAALSALADAHHALGQLRLYTSAGAEALALAGMDRAEANRVWDVCNGSCWAVKAAVESLGGSLPRWSDEDRAEARRRMEAIGETREAHGLDLEPAEPA